MENGLDGERRAGEKSEGCVDGSFISGARSLPLLYYWHGWWGPRPNRVVINYQSNYLMI